MADTDLSQPPAQEGFGAFYRDTQRRLVHQLYALTGSTGQKQGTVRREAASEQQMAPWPGPQGGPGHAAVGAPVGAATLG